MSATRIILAGILGGIAMFIWSSIAHMALPLGKVGIHELPNQQPILGALQTGLGDKSGLYLFPGLGVGDNPTHEQESEAMKHLSERMAANPSGLLVYYPPGARPFTFAKYLGIEFATECFEALLAVFLLAQTRIAGFGGRVGFIFVAGFLAAIATNVSYWNWYGFPADYIWAYMFTQVIGFLCAGIVAALVLPKNAA